MKMIKKMIVFCRVVTKNDINMKNDQKMIIFAQDTNKMRLTKK